MSPAQSPLQVKWQLVESSEGSVLNLSTPVERAKKGESPPKLTTVSVSAAWTSVGASAATAVPGKNREVRVAVSSKNREGREGEEESDCADALTEGDALVTADFCHRWPVVDDAPESFCNI